MAAKKALALLVAGFYLYQRLWVNDRARRKIGKKGRQVGFSYGSTGKHALQSAKEHGPDKIFLSAGERQSKKMCRTFVNWVRATDAGLECLYHGDQAEPWEKDEVFCESIAEKVTTLEVVFRNSRRAMFLPANPDTIRGETGDVILDEFSRHKHAREILKAVGLATARGYDIEVFSSPNGKQGAFYEIYTGTADWSRHNVPVLDAIAQGCPIDYKEMCELLGNDPDSIAQELDAVFLDTVTQFISPDLISFAETDKAGPVYLYKGWEGPGDNRSGPLLHHPKNIKGDLYKEDFERIAEAILELAKGGRKIYMGADIARSRHLTSLWFNEVISDLDIYQPGAHVQRLVVNLHGVSYESQTRVIEVAQDVCQRVAIDTRGIGAKLGEEALRRKGEGRVDQVETTSATNSDIAWRVREMMGNSTFKFCPDSTIRASFRAIKKHVTAGKHDRFDADTTEAGGHGDMFWAGGLALYAADRADVVFAIRRIGGGRTLSNFLRNAASKIDERFPQPYVTTASRARDRTKGY